jgi:hypothetical protein
MQPEPGTHMRNKSRTLSHDASRPVEAASPVTPWHSSQSRGRSSRELRPTTSPPTSPFQATRMCGNTDGAPAHPGKRPHLPKGRSRCARHFKPLQGDTGIIDTSSSNMMSFQANGDPTPRDRAARRRRVQYFKPGSFKMTRARIPFDNPHTSDREESISSRVRHPASASGYPLSKGAPSCVDHLRALWLAQARQGHTPLLIGRTAMDKSPVSSHSGYRAEAL